MFLGDSYTDETIPPDEFVPLNVFKTLQITLTIDGKTVLNGKNAMDFYTQQMLDPQIPINSDGVKSIIFVQGIGILHTPLSTGQHKMELHAMNTIPVQGLTFEYNNTWNITVGG
jgi:hypothetical protein